MLGRDEINAGLKPVPVPGGHRNVMR